MQKFILVIISVLVFVFLAWGSLYFNSLSKTYEPPGNNSFYKHPFEVIAHRGGSLEAPENTLIAFDHATSIDPDVILEFDVHTTADKKVVVFHDTLLQRTTNGEGPIHTKTLEELKKIDAAYNFDAQGEYPMRGKGVQIPTLDEVLERYPQTRMIIEIKPNSIDSAVLVMSVLEKYQRLDKTLLGSEHSPIIKYLKSKTPELLTTAGKDEILRSVMLENIFLERLDSMKADAYCIPEKHEGIQILTQRLLEELHRRSKKAFIWTVNSEENMKALMEKGVDGIITDRPQFLFQLVKNRK